MTDLGFPAYTDADVYAAYDYAFVVDAMRDAFAERAAGTLEAPPRWRVDAGDGELVFTAGAATGGVDAAGFRIYETFPGGEGGGESSGGNTQLVAVYDGGDGSLDALFVGHAIGQLRTGGIGGVAVDALARADAATLGVLGAGFQARSQVGAACAARGFDSVAVYSPTAESRESFASRVDDEVEPAVYALEDPESVVSGADVLVCATDSGTPVFDPEWLEPGMHVTAVGPTFADAHELPPAVVKRADAIVTDSLPQLDAHERRHLVSGAERDRAVELADVLAGDAPGRVDADDLTLFCSEGLAGTEVVLGARLRDRLVE